MIEMNAKVGTIPMRVRIMGKSKANPPVVGDKVRFRDASIPGSPIREGKVTENGDFVIFISLI